MMLLHLSIPNECERAMVPTHAARLNAGSSACDIDVFSLF